MYLSSASVAVIETLHSSTIRVSAPRPCSSSCSCCCSSCNSLSAFCSCSLMSARISATRCSYSLIVSSLAFWYRLSSAVSCFCLSFFTLDSSVSAAVRRSATSCRRVFSCSVISSFSCSALEVYSSIFNCIVLRFCGMTRSSVSRYDFCSRNSLILGAKRRFSSSFSFSCSSVKPTYSAFNERSDASSSVRSAFSWAGLRTASGRSVRSSFTPNSDAPSSFCGCNPV